MLLGLFVDDIIVGSAVEDVEEWKEMKRIFMARFASKDLGPISTMLGMHVTRERTERIIRVDMAQHIETMLREFDMQECTRRDIPMQVGLKLVKTKSGDGSKDDAAGVDEAAAASESVVDDASKHEYQSMVGKLQYISTSLRADISHSVNTLSRYASAPGASHMKAAVDVIRYLKGCPRLPIEFRPPSGRRNTRREYGGASAAAAPESSSSRIDVSAWTDADWGGDLTDRKSTTGYVVKVNGNILSWQSRKQTTVALSTAEAEYMALSACLQEIIWLHALLTELGLRDPKQIRPDGTEVSVQQPRTVMYTDNRAAKFLCEAEGMVHSRTKHIDMRHHFIRDAVHSGEVRIEWCSTLDQQADALTKPLEKQTFKKQRAELMGLDESSTNARAGDGAAAAAGAGASSSSSSNVGGGYDRE